MKKLTLLLTAVSLAVSASVALAQSRQPAQRGQFVFAAHGEARQEAQEAENEEGCVGTEAQRPADAASQ